MVPIHVVIEVQMSTPTQVFRSIQTAIHYPVPIHLQPAYAELGYRKGNLPQAERLANRMLSLPMFPALTARELTYVTTTIQEFFFERGEKVSRSDS